MNFRRLSTSSPISVVNILVGIVLLFVVYAMAWALKHTLIGYLLQLLFTYGAFALLIVFQPELRAFLAHLGRARR